MSDISASTWSATDASNTTAAPDGAPEGMAPSGVNNTMRAIMGGTKRWYEWSIPKQTAGTSTAYTLSYSVAPAALVDGMTHLVEFDQANGASATLNVNSLGAKPLHYYSAGAWRAVPASLFAANATFHVCYNSSAGAYRILGRPDNTGIVEEFAGSTAPAGSLLCYGQAVSRTTYAGLFALLSTTHGSGDGSTTFNLPDRRGNVAAGKANMGGSDRGNLTGGTTLGAALGSETTTVTGTTSGSLTVTTGAATTGTTYAAGSGGGLYTGIASDHGHGGSATGTLSVSGTGSALQPTIVQNFIIRV